jgi:hypothetical protein
VSDIVILASFVLLPAWVFAYLPARARRYFMAAAFAALIAAKFLIGQAGPDNRLLLLPLALLGIVLGGVLVEAVVFVRRLIGRKGEVASHG